MYTMAASLKQINLWEKTSTTMEPYSTITLPSSIQESLLCLPVKDLLTERWFQSLSGTYTWSLG